MSNELTIKDDNKPAVFKPGARLLTGLAARKAAALEKAGKPQIIEPAEMKHRIGIVFDDSVSMGTEQNQDAIAGVEEFLRSCVANETAIAIQPLNKDGLRLNTNLPAVAIYVKGIRSTGGTPLVAQTNEMLYHNNLTRAIVFSDGQPASYPESAYQKLLRYKIPIDTVYIPSGYVEERAEEFMKKLAFDTGGIYLRFERGKSNFRTAFKYLSPGLRHMLADKSFVAKLEGR
jgi:hypothetical protein